MNSADAVTTVDGLLLPVWADAADRLAVEADGVSLTYAELRERVGGLAALLGEHGVGPGQRVAVLLDRSAELVVALLAVLFAGGAHLALDPDDPDERIRFMLADCAPAVVITSAAHRARIGEPGCPVLPVEELTPDRLPAPVARHTGETPAYAIYTSGSTGRPKASLNPHRALVSRLRWLQRRYQLTPEDRVLYKTACGFDVSVVELYWPLSVGAQLVVAAPGGQRDPDYLAEAVLRRGVTVLHFVPSLLELFLAGRPADETYPGLRLLLAGGEALAPELVRRFHRRTPATLHNMYGPSECAVYTTAWECPRDPDPELVPIGYAVDDTELWVLDPQGRPVPPGEAGELFIGGAGLALGYLNRPELTAERFVPDHLGPSGGRLYRSGDLVRQLPDGALEYLGRLDTQLKIRGNRVEPEEVRNTLLALPGVAQAAVVPWQRDGSTELAGFFVPDAEPAPPAEELRALLRTRLPGYLVPAVLAPIDVLPLTPNGKLDRDALAALAARPSPAARPAEQPSGPDEELTELEQAIAAIWQDLLGGPRLGPEDDFFELGGTSIQAVRATQRLSRHLGVTVPVQVMYGESTLCYYAEEVGALAPDAATAPGRPA